MAELGNRLRQHRISQAIELARIAEETKISVRYLQALENEDWEKLPGSIFARSFARQYAQFIGLDSNLIEQDLIALFAIEHSLPAAPPPPRHPIVVDPIPEIAGNRISLWQRLPKPLIGLAAALVLCSSIFLGWQRLRNLMITGLEPSPEIAGRQETPAPAPAVQNLPGVLHASAPVPEKSLDVPAPREGSGVVVQIVASDRTWVSIRANGKKVFSGILNPNDIRNMHGVENAQLVIGNAGGLEIRTDGKSIGPIGPAGQVRVILLTPSGPQILRRTDMLNPRTGQSGVG